MPSLLEMKLRMAYLCHALSLSPVRLWRIKGMVYKEEASDRRLDPLATLGDVFGFSFLVFR